MSYSAGLYDKAAHKGDKKVHLTAEDGTAKPIETDSAVGKKN